MTTEPQGWVAALANMVPRHRSDTRPAAPVAQEPPAPTDWAVYHPDCEGIEVRDGYVCTSPENHPAAPGSAQELALGNDGLTDAERATYAAQWRATYGQKPTAAEADEWLAKAQEPADPMSDERLEKIRNWNAPGTVETYQILDLLAEVDRLRTENAELDRINQQVHTLNQKLVARAVDAERTRESS